MENLTLSNLKIFNLVEAGHSSRTIQRIFDYCSNCKIDKNAIYEAIGHTPTADSIIKDLGLMSESYYSVYCLVSFGVNLFIVERLKGIYLSLETLALDVDVLGEKLKLQQGTLEKIKKALVELKLILDFDLQEEILKYIKENEPVLDKNLKELMLNKHQELSVFEYDNKIDELNEKNILINSFDGLKIKKLSINDYFKSTIEKNDLMVFEKCKGKTLEQIAFDYNITKQRVQQIIQKKILSYPIFENEIKYKNLLSIYLLNDAELSLIGINDKLLLEYVFMKYKFKPKKTALDYIDDFNLFKTNLGYNILKNKDLVIINNELVDLDFISLFKCFIKDKNINSFFLDEIAEEYNSYINALNIYDPGLEIKKSEEDLTIKGRKIFNNKSFIEVFSRHYIVYREDSLSFEFLESMRKYLEEFNGYGAVSLFFDSHKELCLKNNIHNDNELFALMKRIFSNEFKGKIKFDRNPVIVQYGVDKRRFIENLILDVDLPCTVDDYLKYVNKVTGLKEASVLSGFSSIINQFRNSNGLISLDDELSKDDYDSLIECINAECIGLNYLREKLEIKFNFDYEKVEILLNVNNLKKVGYVKTGTTVYDTMFSSRLEAVRSELLNQDYIVSENSLYKISNKEYFYYKMFDLIDECFVVKISENNYLNLLRRGQTELAKNLKIEIEKSLDPEEIYLLDDYMNSSMFNSIVEKNEEFKDLLLSFNTDIMLSFFLTTIRSINYLSTSGTLIFSKADLSMKRLVDSVMTEFDSLTILELRGQLYEKYKIKSDISNGTLSEMGYYCPKSSEKVYLSKEYYEKEMEDLLDGNS